MRGKGRLSGRGPGIEIHLPLMKLGCDLQKETVLLVSPWQYSCELKLTKCTENHHIYFLSDGETEK